MSLGFFCEVIDDHLQKVPGFRDETHVTDEEVFEMRTMRDSDDERSDVDDYGSVEEVVLHSSAQEKRAKDGRVELPAREGVVLSVQVGLKGGSGEGGEYG